MSRATIADVAKLAGVSMKSVSRVMNRESNVSEKLRASVLAAIEALGYVPDMAARSLAGSRVFVIGALFDNPSPNYIIKVQEGVYSACRERGYHLLIETVATEAADLSEQVRDILLTARIDGMVLTPPTTENELIMNILEMLKIPYARIASVSFPGRSVSVVMDDEAAAGEVAQHLLALGHRRFGFVGGPLKHGAAGTRRAGFLAAIAAAGASAVEAEGSFQFTSGIEAGRALLNRANPPTAIFAANDDMAAGVYAAASELGLKIPDDVSVVGFDDSYIAVSVWPPLTTIYQPISEMARRAAQSLIARETREEPIILPHQLVVRASTGTAPKEAV